MAAVVMAVSTAQAAFPGKNGKIAVGVYRIVAHAPGDPDIYTVNPDGSGATALTNDPELDASWGPAWSPDGTKIAFTHRTFNQPPAECGLSCVDVYVMNADGTGVTKLTRDGNSWNPSWSPDGNKIAFARYRNGDGDIYTMNADGTGATQVTTGTASDGNPAWSPTGNEIAFDRFYYPPISPVYKTELHAIRVDGTGERLIVGDLSQHPNWSPDGTKIAFDDEYQIWVVNADGTGRVKLTETPPNPDPNQIFLVFKAQPAWSPDGTTIVFESTGCFIMGCGTPSLATVNPDGTGIAALGVSAGEPDWQPLLGPRRSDYKNAAQFCKAERDFLGDEAFKAKYGTGNGSNAFGKCVSANARG
jgi:Tol biopolymer transport system component